MNRERDDFPSAFQHRTDMFDFRPGRTNRIDPRSESVPGVRRSFPLGEKAFWMNAGRVEGNGRTHVSSLLIAPVGSKEQFLFSMLDVGNEQAVDSCIYGISYVPSEVITLRETPRWGEFGLQYKDEGYILTLKVLDNTVSVHTQDVRLQNGGKELLYPRLNGIEAGIVPSELLHVSIRDSFIENYSKYLPKNS